MKVALIILLLLLFLFIRNFWVYSTRVKIIRAHPWHVFASLPSYDVMLFSVWNWSQDPKDWVKVKDI